MGHLVQYILVALDYPGELVVSWVARVRVWLC